MVLTDAKLWRFENKCEREGLSVVSDSLWPHGLYGILEWVAFPFSRRSSQTNVMKVKTKQKNPRFYLYISVIWVHLEILYPFLIGACSHKIGRDFWNCLIQLLSPSHFPWVLECLNHFHITLTRDYLVSTEISLMIYTSITTFTCLKILPKFTSLYILLGDICFAFWGNRKKTKTNTNESNQNKPTVSPIFYSLSNIWRELS